jgi:hypothetical protein
MELHTVFAHLVPYFSLLHFRDTNGGVVRGFFTLFFFSFFFDKEREKARKQKKRKAYSYIF